MIDMKQNGIEIQELKGFLKKQESQREQTTQIIKEMSSSSRQRFMKGIDKTLENLRQKETEPEDETAKQDFRTAAAETS